MTSPEALAILAKPEHDRVAAVADLLRERNDLLRQLAIKLDIYAGTATAQTPAALLSRVRVMRTFLLSIGVPVEDITDPPKWAAKLTEAERLRAILRDVSEALSGGEVPAEDLARTVATVMHSNAAHLERVTGERDQLRAVVADTAKSAAAIAQRMVETAIRERDEARTEVKVLTAERDMLRHGDAACVDDDGVPFASARTWRSAYVSAVKERDDLRARLSPLLDDLTTRDREVLADVLAELKRAREKWGPQPHPWGLSWYRFDHLRQCAVDMEAEARRTLIGHDPTWAAIIGEEAGEALRESDPARAVAELIQVGAMVLAAMAECPDLQGVDRG